MSVGRVICEVLLIEYTCHTLMVNGLVKTKSDGRASGDCEGRSLGRIRLCAGVATNVVTGDIGDRAVVVGVQANILVFTSGSTVGNKLCEAIVSERSVGKGQQAAGCCEVEVHDAVDPGVVFLIDSGLTVYRVALSFFEVV